MKPGFRDLLLRVQNTSKISHLTLNFKSLRSSLTILALIITISNHVLLEKPCVFSEVIPEGPRGQSCCKGNQWHAQQHWSEELEITCTTRTSLEADILKVLDVYVS